MDSQRQDIILNVISKLMDEQDTTLSELTKIYDEIYTLIETKLPIVLDSGTYPDNATIIRKTNQLLLDFNFLTVLPELAEKNFIPIWGDGREIDKYFTHFSTKSLGISYNSNLPLIVIPTNECQEEKIYAITYMNRKVELSFDEYKCATREIYKKEIDIRKLIKCFVMYFSCPMTKEAYFILPEYVDTHNEYLHILDNENILCQLIIADEKDRWKKCIKKLFKVDTFFFGDASNYKYLVTNYNGNTTLKKEDAFTTKIKELNVPSINFAMEVELKNILLDVLIYYRKRADALQKNISKLAKNSINLKEYSIKSNVKKYHKESIKLMDETERNRKKLEGIMNEVDILAIEFEKQTSNLLLYDLETNIVCYKYTQSLLQTFFKCIYAKEYKTANLVVLKLERNHYQYSAALFALLKYEQGYTNILDSKTIATIKEYPDNLWEIAKIKIKLEKVLGLNDTDLKKIIYYVSPLETGKEYYYFGKKLLDEKKYIGATHAFFASLDNDYEQAGKELMELAEKYPDCNINIEELAENLVPEANYFVGIKSLSEKYKKGVVNLKMAASKHHIDSIETIADMMYKQCKQISWKNMKEEKNKNIAYSVIELYSALDKLDTKEMYQCRIGLMFCKLNDYARAYSILKNINNNEAQYECAKMCQYGNGIAKNLESAKRHYEKVDNDYKDTRVQYDKVCEWMSKAREEQYSEKNNYDPRVVSEYTTSDYCFITTAACLALHDTKDCEQLNLLRKFRDTYISGDGKDGDDLIEEYYRIGPIIVNYIDTDWNPLAIYDELWENYILPSCQMIEKGQNLLAKNIYVNMVKTLCEKYSVPVKQSIMEKYSINVIDKNVCC